VYNHAASQKRHCKYIFNKKADLIKSVKEGGTALFKNIKKQGYLARLICNIVFNN